MFLVRFIYRVVDIMFQDTVAIASLFFKKIYIYICRNVTHLASVHVHAIAVMFVT